MPVSQIRRISEHLGCTLLPHRNGFKIEEELRAFDRIPNKAVLQDGKVSIRGGGVRTNGPLVKVIETPHGRSYLVETVGLSNTRLGKAKKHKILFTQVGESHDRPHVVVDVERGKSFCLMKPNPKRA